MAHDNFDPETSTQSSPPFLTTGNDESSLRISGGGGGGCLFSPLTWRVGSPSFASQMHTDEPGSKMPSRKAYNKHKGKKLNKNQEDHVPVTLMGSHLHTYLRHGKRPPVQTPGLCVCVCVKSAGKLSAAIDKVLSVGRDATSKKIAGEYIFSVRDSLPIILREMPSLV